MQLDAALESDREQQVEREELWERLRDLQVGTHQAGQHAEEEKQDRRIEEIGEDECGVHVEIGNAQRLPGGR